MKNEYLKNYGAPSLDELKKLPSFPKRKDFEKGPIAVIECIEEIPCNPCEKSCPTGAITIGKPITNLPRIHFEKCIGCGICVAACPGLAIYIKHLNYSEEEALISFPYEFLHLPQKDDIVKLVGRLGEEICKGKVVEILNAKWNNHTPIIRVSYNKKYFDKVVTIKRLKKNNCHNKMNNL
ncbi:4Fe-4S dicluster domain-containing protein [Crassaminicella thermophila]|uniref:4Fe-4S dicluster domain-containing protein n=1 Tax=Crassaminicella thermophila TaxID=2599308 RepID=A0A5C0SE62_CRATE|nr:4Fe-4S dicluster domain-containing protein [Crassaminicella thermophila]QEK12440.1 4Fe-4S dicluster domain-containing protein [Crassaminicella thermophila]